ncbi:MAG: DUF2202 domain-containing protein [Phycisphaerae bacterium]|nr:DUF2202 domain-containing protein [Phycisphaerae bacterium]
MTTLKKTLVASIIAAMISVTASAQQACNGQGPARNHANTQANVECDGSGPQQSGRGRCQMRGRGRGAGPRAGQFNQGQTMAPLTEAEAIHVIYMRQEEKLARDVYLTLNKAWDSVVFSRIAGSEQRHMDAIARIIDIQGMDDPASDDSIDVYSNPTFTAMYTDLTEVGKVSYVKALRTGAYIEELDILDLQTSLEDGENEQLIRVFENLMRGSRNHLRGFVAALAQEGETYVPKLMAAEQYDEIVSGQVERGAGQGMGMRRGRGMGQGQGTRK